MIRGPAPGGVDVVLGETALSERVRTAMDAADERILLRALAEAARQFATADVELENSSPNRVDPGVVIASMSARHDMRLLCDLPCGCDEGTCPGLLSQP